MKRNLPGLFNTILLLNILSVIILSFIIMIIQINAFRIQKKKESEFMQRDYAESRQAEIKREVQWAADYIKTNRDNLEQRVGEQVRERTREAYAIAQNIYKTHSEKSDKEIQKIIREALRPIRYAGGYGYFFITDFSGLEILFSDKPEMEGKNLLYLQSDAGDYVIQDMIQICRDKSEGFYEYLWTKPGETGSHHRKISYIKHFEPYDWLIGTGLYLQDEEENLKQELLSFISTIRFGQEGYIFVNSLDGYALVSNGELMPGDKKLWEVFDSNPEKTKELFHQELNAAIKPEGDYIYYRIRKLSDSNKESPKTSYIQGLKELNWLIGAGIYLDDVQEEIDQLKKLSERELRQQIIITLIITLLLLAFFVISILLLGNWLRHDFRQFSSFFQKAVLEDIRIDLNIVRFRELKELAIQANQMQNEKILTQKKLQESETRFRILAENSRDMIFKMNFPSGEYEYVSPAALEITGYTAQEIMDQPFIVRSVIHPDWREWLEDRFADIAKGKMEDSYEYKIITKTGEERWVNQTNNLITHERTGKATLIGRLIDDTQRKKVEEEMNRNTRMKAIGQLAGGVAHDFNNVLTGILNASNVLNSPKREMDEKGKAMAEIIRNAALRAAELTAKLSAFSGKRTLQLKSLDLHLLIEETETILQRTIDKKIKIELELNAVNFHIYADGSELQSMLLNLGINSSHAMEDSGKIIIKTQNRNLSENDCFTLPFECEPGPYLQIEVQDTGTGMDEETLTHIFEPFFTTKETGKGSGLGLAAVYQTIKDHKGSIEVTSIIDEGTSFSILLPCPDIIEQPEEKKAHSRKAGSGTILFVDDEEFIRLSGKTMLEEAGYHVITAIDGKDGVKIFQENRVDLVIMDVIMPEMNGIDAFFEIRKLRSDCPVIMISGYTKDEKPEKLLSEEKVRFLKKPFTEKDLADEIFRLLN